MGAKSDSRIISASRRTDIPAYFGEWFIRRIREGFCDVPNPVVPSQLNRVSVSRDCVDLLVFWTRCPQSLFPHLDELENRGYPFYFLFTLMDNPRQFEPNRPDLFQAVHWFQRLADRIGPDRVIWRYDPLIFSSVTGPGFHRETFTRVASMLKGYTRRVIISVLDLYRKVGRNLKQLSAEGVTVSGREHSPLPDLSELFRDMSGIARQNGMSITSCAEEWDLSLLGIQPGKCIDDEFIRDVFGFDVTRRKDPSQRSRCQCVVSRDIGMYDTCLSGCRYCYALSDPEAGIRNAGYHSPGHSSLLKKF